MEHMSPKNQSPDDRRALEAQDSLAAWEEKFEPMWEVEAENEWVGKVKARLGQFSLYHLALLAEAIIICFVCWQMANTGKDPPVIVPIGLLVVALLFSVIFVITLILGVKDYAKTKTNYAGKPPDSGNGRAGPANP